MVLLLCFRRLGWNKGLDGNSIGGQRGFTFFFGFLADIMTVTPRFDTAEIERAEDLGEDVS